MARVANPSAYPLAWPRGRPRTQSREQGRFVTQSVRVAGYRFSQPLTVAEARKRLARELDLLGAKLPVLSSNIGPNGAGRGKSNDPGVAVYFQLRGKPMVLACDRFTEVAQNIAAVAAHIDAMRRIERYGVGTTEQMFAGFTALPPPIAPDDWRAALGNPASLAEAEAAFRERMKRAHPDAGGTHAAAAALNAAIGMAREVLG